MGKRWVFLAGVGAGVALWIGLAISMTSRLMQKVQSMKRTYPTPGEIGYFLFILFVMAINGMGWVLPTFIIWWMCCS